MTVRELARELMKCDPDTEVIVVIPEHTDPDDGYVYLHSICPVNGVDGHSYGARVQITYDKDRGIIE